MTIDKIIRHIEIELMRHEDHLKSKHVHSSQKEWVRGNIFALNGIIDLIRIYERESKERLNARMQRFMDEEEEC
jgi:hypothetical protein